MARQESVEETRYSSPAALAMLAFALPLFVWSAFNAGYFKASVEEFVVPLAVFVGGPIALACAMWALHRRDAYLATAAGAFGAFWIGYGTLLWLIQRGVIVGETTGDIRGFFFIPWAVTFSIVWLASIREQWSLAAVALAATVMFVLLSIGHYADSTAMLRVAGWVGFLTAGLAWYMALAEMVNIEFRRPVLPISSEWLRHYPRPG